MNVGVVRALSSKSSRSIVVALSGGVDSAVAAALLQQQCESSSETILAAIHMSNWNSGDDDSVLSCSERDWNDAQSVSKHLQLEISRQYFENDYWHHVFEPYLQGIMQGSMGNPDIGCNLHVKFGSLRYHVSKTFGSDARLATGHYARLWHRRHNNNKLPEFVEETLQPENEWVLNWGIDSVGNAGSSTLLFAAADKTKDQSYFLSACPSEKLANVIFPLGEYTKKVADNVGPIPTVRQLAREFNLPNAEKKESMGICFVGKRPGGFSGFVQEYLPPATSTLDFIDVDTGEILHTTKEPSHGALYTIGQGAKLGGFSEKYFVTDIQSDRVYVCRGTHHPALYCNSLQLDGKSMTWTAGQSPTPLLKHGRMRMQCRIRHLQPLLDCELVLGTQHGSNLNTVRFDKAVRGATPGQMCVFYDMEGLLCLGGAPISDRGPSFLEQGFDLPKDLLHPAGHNDLSINAEQT